MNPDKEDKTKKSIIQRTGERFSFLNHLAVIILALAVAASFFK
jgi:hypothetical protein